jgi:hypothetical protein
VQRILSQKNNWSFAGQSSDSAEPSFWYLPLNEDSELLNLFNAAIKNHFDFKEIKIMAFYANGQSNGQCGSFHLDSKDPSCRTLLFYANPKWEVEWGGFTVFKNSSGEFLSATCPAVNKAVLFSSNILHAGFDPTIFYRGLRVTIALKFMASENV